MTESSTITLPNPNGTTNLAFNVVPALFTFTEPANGPTTLMAAIGDLKTIRATQRQGDNTPTDGCVVTNPNINGAMGLAAATTGFVSITIPGATERVEVASQRILIQMTSKNEPESKLTVDFYLRPDTQNSMFMHIEQALRLGTVIQSDTSEFELNVGPDSTSLGPLNAAQESAAVARALSFSFVLRLAKLIVPVIGGIGRDIIVQLLNDNTAQARQDATPGDSAPTPRFFGIILSIAAIVAPMVIGLLA